MRNFHLKIIGAFIAFAFIFSCNEDDYTGDSTATVNSPSLSVSLDFANTETLVEDDVTYGFTVNLSEPQVVDVRVYLNQVGGDATSGDDFTIPSYVTIPAGSTSASDVIAIHSDDLVEDTETAIIEIGTGLESNVSAVNKETVTFNIANLVEGDLLIGLNWNAMGHDFSGNLLSPTELADMRLLITDVPYTSIIDEADGAAFESITLTSASADGEYYVVADFYAVYSEEEAYDIDLSVNFNQTGVINDLEFNFPAALNSGNSCSGVYFILAKITKSGDSYTIEEVGGNSPVTAAPFVGTATVVVDDWADYSPGETVEIEAGANPNQFYIRAYTNPYIANTDTAYMVVDIDPATGNCTVMSNEDFDYGCSNGDVVGAGSVNACAGTIDLTLDFLLGGCGDYSGNQFTLQL